MVANIDPLYLLSPIVVIGFSLGLVAYWHYKRTLGRSVLFYSFVAYFGAIIAKAIVQGLTYNALDSVVSGSPTILGVYFGGQTAIFEVGGAFLVASIAVSRKRFRMDDSEGFGMGLAFWENGVLLSIPLLLEYVSYYVILSMPSTTSAQTIYSTLSTNSPGLFNAPLAALPLVGYSILERVSSLLGHFSWGLLAVAGAIYKKRVYLAVALPIGFIIDFLSPFGSYIPTLQFELLEFAIMLVSLIVTLMVTRSIRKEAKAEASVAPPSATHYPRAQFRTGRNEHSGEREPAFRSVSTTKRASPGLAARRA